LSAGTSNRDGRPSNPAHTTGTPPPRGALWSSPFLLTTSSKSLGGLSHGATAPVSPVHFSDGRQPACQADSQHRHFTTTVSCWNTSPHLCCFELSSPPLRHGLRRCGPLGQRPSLFPAVPHRPTALVRFSTRPLGRRWLMEFEGRSPNIACLRRASSALGTPFCDTSYRYPGPVPNASTAGTFPIYSTAE